MAIGLKGNKRLCGCLGCCFVSFPSLAEAPCSLFFKSKATSPARDGQGKGRAGEWFWPSLVSRILWLLGLFLDCYTFCVYLPECVKMGIWLPISLLWAEFAIWCCRCVISLILVYVWVCLKGRSPGSSCIYVCVCACVSVIPDQLYHHTVRPGSDCLMLA